MVTISGDDLRGHAGKSKPAIVDTILSTVPALVVILDRQGRIVRFNRACEELIGYCEGEVLGRLVWESLIPPEQVAAVQAVFRSLAAGDFPSSFRNDWVTKNGERRFIEWSNSAVLDAAGDVAFVIGTGIDLTRQLRIDSLVEALRASEARYSGIVSIAADAIISVDESQRIIMFNDGAHEIFGWSADEVIGEPLDVLLPERFRVAHRRTHMPAFADSPTVARRMGERREIFGLRKDGEEFPAEASISKLTVGSERIVTVVLRDITARKRREATQSFLVEVGVALSSSLDYSTTLRHVARLAVQRLADFCIIDIVTTEGDIERLETAHGDPGQTELARRFKEIPLDRRRPHLSSAALGRRRSVLVADVTPAMIDELTQSPEHRELLERLRPVSYMTVPLAVRDRVLGALVFVSSTRRYDADDLVVAQELARRAALAIDNARLYEEAQRAVRARDEVVSIVAHDLGNPISAIRIGTSLLLKGVADAADAAAAREHLAAIRASTEQMERLIANLLDLRKIETGRLLLDRRRYEPTSILQTLRQAFELLAQDHGIGFELVIDDSVPPQIEADPDRIMQVLDNLVGNAFKFTRRGGSVTVRCAGTGTEVLFEVRDTGRGIEPDQLPYLFDRFWQAERSSRRSVGLGLSIAKGIVSAHGGRIWVESALGRGASFYFAIPVDVPDSAPDSIPLAT